MGIKYDGTIERMLRAGRLKNVSEAARATGVTPQAFSNYKKKGEIPSNVIIKFARTFGLSVNWLMTGEGQMRLAAPAVEETDLDLLIEGCADETPVISVMLSTLKTEELIYVGKLLKILRGTNDGVSAAIKNTVDAFLSAGVRKTTDIDGF